MMGNRHTMSGTGANVSGELVTRSPVWLLGRGYPMDSLGHQVTEPAAVTLHIIWLDTDTLHTDGSPLLVRHRDTAH